MTVSTAVSMPALPFAVRVNGGVTVADGGTLEFPNSGEFVFDAITTSGSGGVVIDSDADVTASSLNMTGTGRTEITQSGRLATQYLQVGLTNSFDLTDATLEMASGASAIIDGVATFLRSSVKTSAMNIRGLVTATESTWTSEEPIRVEGGIIGDGTTFDMRTTSTSRSGIVALGAALIDLMDCDLRTRNTNATSVGSGAAALLTQEDAEVALAGCHFVSDESAFGFGTGWALQQDGTQSIVIQDSATRTTSMTGYLAAMRTNVLTGAPAKLPADLNTDSLYSIISPGGTLSTTRSLVGADVYFTSAVTVDEAGTLEFTSSSLTGSSTFTIAGALTLTDSEFVATTYGQLQVTGRLTARGTTFGLMSYNYFSPQPYYSGIWISGSGMGDLQDCELIVANRSSYAGSNHPSAALAIEGDGSLTATRCTFRPADPLLETRTSHGVIGSGLAHLTLSDSTLDGFWVGVSFALPTMTVTATNVQIPTGTPWRASGGTMTASKTLRGIDTELVSALTIGDGATLTLSDGTDLTLKSSLTVASGGTLTAAPGTSIVADQQLTVEQGGVATIDRGTVTTSAAAYLQVQGEFSATSSTLTLSTYNYDLSPSYAGIAATGSGRLTLAGCDITARTLSTYEGLSRPAAAVLVQNTATAAITWSSIRPTDPLDPKRTVYGIATLSGAQSTIANSTIDGFLAANYLNLAGGRLSMTNVVVPRGFPCYAGGGTMTASKTLRGIDTELMAALTIGDGATLTLSDGTDLTLKSSLTVASGGRLTAAPGTSIVADQQLTVEQGGVATIDRGTVTTSAAAYLQVQGEFSATSSTLTLSTYNYSLSPSYAGIAATGSGRLTLAGCDITARTLSTYEGLSRPAAAVLVQNTATAAITWSSIRPTDPLDPKRTVYGVATLPGTQTTIANTTIDGFIAANHLNLAGGRLSMRKVVVPRGTVCRGGGTTLTVDQTIDGFRADTDASVVVPAGRKLILRDAELWTTGSPSASGDGSIVLTDSILEASGALNLTETATLTTTGGRLAIGAALSMAGSSSLTATGGAVSFGVGSSVAGSARLTVRNADLGLRLTSSSALTVQDSATALIEGTEVTCSEPIQSSYATAGLYLAGTGTAGITVRNATIRGLAQPSGQLPAYGIRIADSGTGTVTLENVALHDFRTAALRMGLNSGQFARTNVTMTSTGRELEIAGGSLTRALSFSNSSIAFESGVQTGTNGALAFANSRVSLTGSLSIERSGTLDVTAGSTLQVTDMIQFRSTASIRNWVGNSATRSSPTARSK